MMIDLNLKGVICFLVFFFSNFNARTIKNLKLQLK